MKKFFAIAVLVAVAAGAFWFIQREQSGAVATVTDFASCVAAGHPVAESFPRQCTVPDGETYTEDIGNIMEKSDFIQLASPFPNDPIASPLVIYGQARLWYFEASFPIYLKDADGNVIATGIATALDDWMTEEFVPFRAVLEWEGGPTQTGTLVFQKDNPSGLPEHDDEMHMPVQLLSPEEAAEFLRPVQVFFQKNVAGDPVLDCSVVEAVTRYIAPSQGVGRTAVEALLGGLAPSEVAMGYSSALPQHVMLSNLSFLDGTVSADFSERLQEGVAGSCRVTAIRAQIEETIKQFEEVTNVEILIDGEAEDILQP